MNESFVIAFYDASIGKLAVDVNLGGPQLPKSIHLACPQGCR